MEEQIKKIYSLLPSYDEWEAIGNKPRPYVFTIEKPNQKLVYIGATHSRKPDEEQFSIIEREWKTFLESDDSSKEVFIEGGLRRLHQSKEENIKENSEAGFMTFLAHEAGVSIFCPEPDRGLERKELLDQFSKEEIQYYYFARLIPSWHETKKTQDRGFEDHIARYVQGLKKGVDEGWHGFDFSIKHMTEIHEDLFHKRFDEEDIDFIRKILNPTTNFSVINRVARASSDYRDAWIVSAILNAWEAGMSLFVVFGFKHAVSQEKALQTLLVS